MTGISGLLAGCADSGPPSLLHAHKLLALGAVIATGVQVAGSLKTASTPALPILLLVVAALSVVALFASGALMSEGRLDYGLMRAIHRIAPAVFVIAMVLVVYLLPAPKSP